MVDGVFLYWLGLVLLSALLLPAFMQWTARFLHLCIDLLAELVGHWQGAFPVLPPPTYQELHSSLYEAPDGLPQEDLRPRAGKA